MSTVQIEAVVAAVTFISSVSASAFISGTRWGRVESTLHDLQQDRVRQGDITGLRDRLSRIEGMFTLTLKDGDRKGS